LSAAYDVTGDGDTVIKGGWGRYDHLREIDEISPANPLGRVTATYRWRDLNGNRLYDAGEVNLDPNGPDFVTQGGAAVAVPDPDEQQPKVDQFFMSLERELMPNFAVRVTGIHSRSFQIARRVGVQRPYSAYNIPITNPDPGPDGRAGTADDPGTFITYYDFPASLTGRSFEQNMLTVPTGQPDATFKSIELAASKRMSSAWQFMASYSATKKNIPVPQESAFTPNAEIFAADRTWEWVARASGAYVFPYEVTVSANLEHRSGDAQARQVLFRGGRQIPTIVLNVEPIGSLRLPHINFLDLRVEKTFRFQRSRQLTARLNIFNALNANTITARSVRSGATFLRPVLSGASPILPPRLVELSASYAF
jgi:hypothetical protein